MCGLIKRSSRDWSYVPLALASNILMLLQATFVVGQYMTFSDGATSKNPAYGLSAKSFSLTIYIARLSFAGFDQ